MYLFGVDFEKIHREAVREALRKEVRGESLRNLMANMSWTAGQAMDALGIPAEEREKYAAMLAQEA